MKMLSPASISMLRATSEVSPSTFMRKRLAAPAARVTVLSLRLSDVRLYTVTMRVVVPTVVKTVSNASVSTENSSRTPPSSTAKPSLSQESESHGTAAKTMIYSIFLIIWYKG